MSRTFGHTNRQGWPGEGKKCRKRFEQRYTSRVRRYLGKKIIRNAFNDPDNVSYDMKEFKTLFFIFW